MTPFDLIKRLKKEELINLCAWVRKNSHYQMIAPGSCRAMRLSLRVLDGPTLEEAIEEVLGVFFDDADVAHEDDDSEMEDEEFYEDEPDEELDEEGEEEIELGPEDQDIEVRFADGDDE